ncbi:MAG TPA: 3-oxoacyl-[acyl-carrier-protein] reductase [Armatimonadota bacterium]
MRLQGKTALVTGSSRGLGKAIALAMAREGADIGVNYVTDPDGLNEKDARGVAAEIEAMGRRAAIFQADVSNEDQVGDMTEKFIETFGKVDILVNNAGILRDITLKNMSKKDWDAVIAVNLTGVFNCTHAVINYMREAGCGRIISLSSIVGQTGHIGQCNYAATKAGVMGFTKSVAREVARRGVTANAIAPGLIETDMFHQIPEEARAAQLSEIPMGRFGKPDDIANVAIFLASDEAAYVTGQVIHVNGGWYM